MLKENILYQLSEDDYALKLEEQKKLQVDPKTILERLFPNGPKFFNSSYNLSPYHDFKSTPKEWHNSFRYMGNLVPYFYYLAGDGPLPSLERNSYTELCKKFITISPTTQEAKIINATVKSTLSGTNNYKGPTIESFKYTKEPGFYNVILGMDSGKANMAHGATLSISDGTVYNARRNDYVSNVFNTPYYKWYAIVPGSANQLTAINSTTFNNGQDLGYNDNIRIKVIINMYNGSDLVISYMFGHECNNIDYNLSEPLPKVTNATFDSSKDYHTAGYDHIGIKDVDVGLCNIARDALDKNVFSKYGIDFAYSRVHFLYMPVYNPPITHGSKAVAKYDLPMRDILVNRPEINDKDAKMEDLKFTIRHVTPFNGHINQLDIDIIACVTF